MYYIGTMQYIVVYFFWFSIGEFLHHSFITVYWPIGLDKFGYCKKKKKWMENISIHHFFLYLPCTFPQKAQGWARICALYMEKTFTSVWLSGFRTSHLLTCRKNRWQPVTSSWYVYLRTVPSFRGKDMPYTYRRGLSALLVLDRWACEGLGTRNGQR